MFVVRHSTKQCRPIALFFSRNTILNCLSSTIHSPKPAVAGRFCVPVASSHTLKAQIQTECKKKVHPVPCGKISWKYAGIKVRVRGFLQYSRLGFLVLRDSSGLLQILVKNFELQSLMKDVPYESYLEVSGVVVKRPDDQINKKMKTGFFEIDAEELSVLNKAKDELPFLIRSHNAPTEALGLKHRYLHLRMPHMQENIRVRSQLSKKMRDYLQDEDDFVEITTPTLSVNTPGGSQEFVVPTQQPGKFYSLVQSPQAFKQLLMVGGFEKYFQFAICYRDEGSRADRQPEFMQLDIEMCDATQEGIIDLMENLIKYSWPQKLKDVAVPFPMMTYEQAMNNYGSDKPDIRFQMQIRNVTDIVRNSGENLLSESLKEIDSEACCIVVPEKKTLKLQKEWSDFASEEFDLKGVSLLKVKNESESSGLTGSVSKTLSKSSQESLVETLQASHDDVIVLAVGPKNKILKLLGRLRLKSAYLLETQGMRLRDPEDLKFLWVVDFPLFEEDESTGELKSCHHPFTAPQDESWRQEDLLKVKSQHYDLVLNGCEVAGGSIRNHNAQTQREIFDILKIDSRELNFLLEALECGAPPHGGIALGFDRYVATLLNCQSIRDVMAFPKSKVGNCLMTEAPSTISPTDKKLYNL